MRGYVAIALALILFTNSAQALQIKNAKDDELITANIASHSLTHIQVKGDRIKSVRGLHHQFNYVSDKADGSLFLIPSSANGTKPIQVFLTTEQHHHYPLILKPTSENSESIRLLPESEAIKSQAAIPVALDKNEQTMEQISQMLDSQPIATMTRESFQEKSTKIGPRLLVKKVAQYRGVDTSGRVLMVKNTGNENVFLEPKLFMDTDVIAIGMTQRKLAKNQQSRVAIIKRESRK